MMLPSLMLQSSTTLSYEEIVEKMMENVPIKDRYHHRKLQKECFVGEEAVDWMVLDGITSTVDEAVALGNL